MDDRKRKILEGNLLKHKVGGLLGRSKWIPKYVEYDYNTKTLKQYAKESKPTLNTKPSKIYELSKCSLFAYDEKPFAFTIVDNLNDKKSLTLATSNEDDYNIWISTLLQEKESLSPSKDTYKNDDIDKIKLILPKLEGEVISQFFSQHDVRRDGNDEPLISIELLNSLILSLDDSINANCGKYIARDVKIELDSFISLSEFLKWWLIFRSNNQKSMQYKISDSIHFVGFISSHVLQKQTDISSLLKIRVPELVDLVSDWEYVHTSEDWDKSYQYILTEIDSIEKASILKYEVNLDGLEVQTQIEALQHLRLTACINLYKYLGDLSSTAIKCCEVIIEEYSLPDELKTIKKISESETEEEVYSYDSLLFRIAAVPGEEQDATPSIERHIDLITDDEHHRNYARLAFHSTQELRKAVMELREEDLLAKKKLEFERSLGFNLENDLKNSKNQELLPTPSVRFTAIIDYCGFRIEVHNPMNEESSNLVYGKNEDKNIYISDSEIIQILIQKIGDKMKIGTYTRDASTGSFAKKPANFICPQLKVYQYRTSSDYYFTHTDLLLPQDLPQSLGSSASIDAIELDTKKIRPELLKFLPSTVTTNFCREDIKDQNELDFIGKSIESLHYLYMEHLPQTASILDNMSFSVLDSYGLTKFLHDRGVNCRMMGILYCLSKVSIVKKAILIECICRSCKVLLNNALRQCARRGKAESIIALLREMSDAQDYLDHQASIVEDKKRLVNDFFNLCLGSGSDSNTFWSGILADEVSRKFNIDLRNLLKIESDKASLHMPQLFMALQHHTGVVCTNYRNVSLKFEEADQPYPLTSDDFKTYFTVDSMVPTFCPGNCGKVSLAAEALLGCQLYSEAIFAFRLRVSSYLLLGSAVNSPKFTTMLGHSIYLLALSYYLNGQPKEALNTLNLYMNNYLDESPLLSRMLSLLMSIKFTMGEINEAMIIFEKALDMYTFCLGNDHPIISAHFCTLGDLYYNSRAYSQAKVMMLLALESGRQILGEEHVISVAYRTKLASLYILEEKFLKAEELMRINSLVCKSLTSKNVQFQKESIDIYFGLATSLIKVRKKDEAQQLLIYVKEMLNDKNVNVNRELYLATSLLLSDIYSGKLQSDESQKELEDAWFLLQQSKDLRMSSSGLVNITCQMISCYLSTLDLNVRLLLENIEKEIDAEILPIANVKLWDEACQIVIKALWTNNPQEFVDNIIKKYHSFEVMNDDSKKSLLHSDTLPQDSALSLALQIAVIQKIFKKSSLSFLKY